MDCYEQEDLYETIFLSLCKVSDLFVAEHYHGSGGGSGRSVFFLADSKYTVHIGAQGATLKSDGFGIYTQNLHNNEESRGLGGIYIGGSAMLNDAHFIQADLSHLTRWSGSMELDF